jgi:hypothetical protein
MTSSNSRMALVFLLSFLCLLPLISASHFAFGTISWIKDRHAGTLDSSTGVTPITITFQSGWRTNFDWQDRVFNYDGTTYSSTNQRSPNLGQYVQFGDYVLNALYTTSSTQGAVALASLTRDGTNYAATSNDNNQATWKNPMLKVKNLYNRGYFVGEAKNTFRLPDTIASGKYVQRWFIYYDECCRVGGLSDGNAGGNDRTFAMIPIRPFETFASQAKYYLQSSFNTTSPPRQISTINTNINWQLYFAFNDIFNASQKAGMENFAVSLSSTSSSGLSYYTNSRLSADFLVNLRAASLGH